MNVLSAQNVLGSIEIEPFARDYAVVGFLLGVLVVLGFCLFMSSEYGNPIVPIMGIFVITVLIFVNTYEIEKVYAAAVDARVAAVEKELGGPLIDGDVVDGGILVVGSTDGSVRIVNSIVSKDSMLFFDASSSSPEVVN